MQQLAIWLTTNLRWLKGQLMSWGRTPEEADDLIQEAYLRVHEYCEKGGVAREPEKVLVRAVMRLSMNEGRDQRRRSYSRQAVEDLPLIDPMPLPEEQLATENSLCNVIRLLEGVRPRSREVFLLHRVDRLTYAQIAKQLGVSVSAIEKHIAWVMALLLDATEREDRL